MVRKRSPFVNKAKANNVLILSVYFGLFLFICFCFFRLSVCMPNLYSVLNDKIRRFLEWCRRLKGFGLGFGLGLGLGVRARVRG
jgi:hypothetical protein